MGIVDVTKQRNDSEKIDSLILQCIRNDVIIYMKKTMPIEAVEWFRCVRRSDQCVID